MQGVCTHRDCSTWREGSEQTHSGRIREEERSSRTAMLVTGIREAKLHLILGPSESAVLMAPLPTGVLPEAAGEHRSYAANVAPLQNVMIAHRPQGCRVICRCADVRRRRIQSATTAYPTGMQLQGTSVETPNKPCPTGSGGGFQVTDC